MNVHYEEIVLVPGETKKLEQKIVSVIIPFSKGIDEKELTSMVTAKVKEALSLAEIPKDFINVTKKLSQTRTLINVENEYNNYSVRGSKHEKVLVLELIQLIETDNDWNHIADIFFRTNYFSLKESPVFLLMIRKLVKIQIIKKPKIRIEEDNYLRRVS